MSDSQEGGVGVAWRGFEGCLCLCVCVCVCVCVRACMPAMEGGLDLLGSVDGGGQRSPN